MSYRIETARPLGDFGYRTRICDVFASLLIDRETALDTDYFGPIASRLLPECYPEDHNAMDAEDASPALLETRIQEVPYVLEGLADAGVISAQDREIALGHMGFQEL